MTKRILTQDELKTQLHYDLNTGLFKKLSTNSNVGSIWNHGYYVIYVFRKPYLAHRLAWLYVYGSINKNIDHIDNVRTNNRIDNLREASNSDNARNKEKYKNNTSGFKGVYFDKAKHKYVAHCWANGKQKTIGRFITPELASEAYQNFAKLHHGEFYRNTI